MSIVSFIPSSSRNSEIFGKLIQTRDMEKCEQELTSDG